MNSNKKNDKPELSMIVPFFNEEKNVRGFFDVIVPILQTHTQDYEIICVNDGSTDQTLDELIRQKDNNSKIHIIDFSRNFGKEAALSAGFDYSRGRAVIPIDSDMQDPPELIPELIAKWRQGYEIVHAKRRKRTNDSVLKRKTAGWFYKFYNKTVEVRIPENVGDFRLLDRCVVDAILRLPERNRFMKGLFAWVGFKHTYVEYDRPKRHLGETKWGYWKLWNYAIDGITAFSTIPLRVWSYFGLLISSGAFLYALFIIFRTLFEGRSTPGYASMIVVILFIGGIQLISLGILGEYMGRAYTELKQRPIYIVRKTYGPTEPVKSGHITESQSDISITESNPA